MTGAPVQALVVVDMQEDFFQQTELRRCRDDVVRHCNELIRRARRAGAPVFLVRTMHRADQATWTLNMREDGQGLAIAGEPGAEPVAGLDVEGAVQVIKRRDSAFFGTDLRDRLRARSITSFALCGVSTESCVAHTAADAYAHDLVVVLVDRATASISADLHDRTAPTAPRAVPSADRPA